MRKLLIALALILSASAGVYAYYTRSQRGDKAAVTQVAITQGDVVEAVQATGTLEPLRTVQVGSQVSGVVKALYADFNSIVRKDQIIAELDPALLQVQVEVQKANIDRQQGDIGQQSVQLENDQTNLNRTQAQFDKGLVSAQQLEASQLQVKSRQASIESAKKQLIEAEASLHQAELNVSYCTIRSPVDGVVVDRKVDIGQAVQASMTTPQFFTIATDLTTLKLSALVDESDIGYIRRGMPVTFTVDAYGQDAFSGTVDAVRLNAQTANNVVTYPVWINVENPALRLRPSMTANLKVVIEQATNVLKVPNQALRFRPTSDTYAWLGLTPPAGGKGRGGSPGIASLGGPSQPTTAGSPAAAAIVKRRDSQIDDLFAAVQKPVQSGQIWVYDETASDASKRLRSVNVRVGLTDGRFTELLSSAENLGAGAMVVTGVVAPSTALPKAGSGSTNIFDQRGGPPGGFGGGRFGG
jgi:HlyD family secretion protein